MFSVSRRRPSWKFVHHGLLFQIATFPVEAVPRIPRWRYSTRVAHELLTRHPNANVSGQVKPDIRQGSRPIWNAVRSADADHVDAQADEVDGEPSSTNGVPEEEDGESNMDQDEVNIAVGQDEGSSEGDIIQREHEQSTGMEGEDGKIPATVDRRIVAKDARRLLTKRELRKLLAIPKPPTKSSPSRKRQDQDRGPSTPDESAMIFFTEVLRLLWTMPIEKQVENDQVKVYLSLSTLVALTGRLHQNIWIHPARDGCQVHVQDHNHEVNGKRLVCLRGSPRAIELTKAYLLRTERSLHPDAILNTTMNPLLVTPEPADGRSVSHEVDIVAIAEPEVWTVRSFMTYVERLVARNTTTHLDRVIAQSGRLKDLPGLPRASDPRSKEQPLFQVIAGRLDQLFTDPKLQYCVSSAAQDLAIQYLLKYYQLRQGDSLKAIWSIVARDRDCVTRLWNHLFKTALRTQSVHYIKSLIEFSRELNIPVFTDTGLEIFRQTKSVKVKIGVSQWLAENNFLKNPHLVRRFTAAIMPDLVKSHFKKGESADSFFERMDKGVGPVWLESPCITAMFSCFARNRLRQPAEDSLTLLLERGVKLHTGILSHMTYIYYRQGIPISRILDLWSSAWAKQVGRADRFVVPYAFMSAWNSFQYNTARVLWHFAALRGVLTYQMRQLVYWGLVRNRYHKSSSWTSKNPQKSQWNITAAKVIAGVVLDTTELARLYPELVQDYLNSTHPSSSSSSSTTTTTTTDVTTTEPLPPADISTPIHWLIHAHATHRESQKLLVRTILRSDEWALVHHTLPADFKLIPLLREAIELDEQWKRDRVLQDPEKGLDWMIDHAIRLPVMRREKPLDLLPESSSGIRSDGEKDTHVKKNQDEDENDATAATADLAVVDGHNRPILRQAWMRSLE